MKADSAGRVLAAALMGVASGSFLHYDYLRWHERGKDAFIAFQAQRFDRYFTREHGLAGSLIVGIVLMALTLGAYEGLARMCGRMLSAEASDKL